MLLGRYLGECAGISGTCLGVVSENLCLSCHGGVLVVFWGCLGEVSAIGGPLVMFWSCQVSVLVWVYFGPVSVWLG